MIKKDNTNSNKSKWNDPGPIGTFMMVSKHELEIDVVYQREPTGAARIKKIAREFKWSRFGALIVSERKDGFYVIDGGSRLRASFLRDDIIDIPCMIFGLTTIIDEAKDFEAGNGERKNLTAYEYYHAGLYAGEHTCTEADKIVKKCGYRIVPSSPGSYEISAIATLRNMITKSRKSAYYTFDILSQVADGDVINTHEMKGLFYLIETNRTSDFKGQILDNMKEAGIDKIRTDIKQNILHRGKGCQSVIAEGMLNIINKNMSSDRIAIPSI